MRSQTYEYRRSFLATNDLALEHISLLLGILSLQPRFLSQTSDSSLEKIDDFANFSFNDIDDVLGEPIGGSVKISRCGGR